MSIPIIGVVAGTRLGAVADKKVVRFDIKKKKKMKLMG